MIGAIELSRRLGLAPPTDEQAAVIEAPLGPLLVIAGAGSGKTETMAGRVLYLVANGLVRPDQVLGLTFTRKAASGLGVRIRTRLRSLAARLPDIAAAPTGPDGGEPEVGTYHAFGGRLISEFGPLLGVEPQARVLTATGAWQLARRVVSRWDGDLETSLRPDQVTELMLAVSGGLADHLTGTAELSDAVQLVMDSIRRAPAGPRQRKAFRSGLEGHLRRLADRQRVLPLVEAFETAKRAAGVVDFADQMQLAAGLATDLQTVRRTVRDRYRLVLLDEYQDTGHAQRVILRSLFGMPPGGEGAGGHAVTAVGDPVQTIYSWRGASASNLPRFVDDFPEVNGAAAPVLPLSTSFRNAGVVLDLANGASAPIRVGRVPVRALRPRPDAPRGQVRLAICETAVEEEEWVAATLAQRWADVLSRTGQTPTVAVLLRRRRDMESYAETLRAHGLPVEVVGLGGLLVEPEIADLVALLRVLIDPSAGSSMLRLLTGARWRIGARDLAALSSRAGVLAGGRPPATPGGGESAAVIRAALARATSDADNDSASLVDAVADPGPALDYSRLGYERLAALAEELRRLRTRLSQPLPDLMADLERSTGLDIEVLVHSRARRAHLDAFADVVGDLAETGAGPSDLVDYLLTAAEREDGLAPGEEPQVSGRVQVLTVHAAKGLEWDTVAIPQACQKIFPSIQFRGWLTEPGQLPPGIRGDAADLPSLTLAADGDQRDIELALTQHTDELKGLHELEERRLWYVALTRAEHTVLVSAHHWGRTAATRYGPGQFLRELAELEPVPDGMTVDRWAPDPADGAANPLTATPVTGLWPVDPLGSRRQAIEEGADLVRVARRDRSGEAGSEIRTTDQLPGMDGGQEGGSDTDHWARDVRVLLAERQRNRFPIVELPMPSGLSVSALVDLAQDPAELARRLRRPVPAAPSPQARRGSAFHAWLERRFTRATLLDVADLPGAADGEAGMMDAGTVELTRRFLASEWAERFPIEVELSFSTVIADFPVRGRIDAVFADPDGGITVVDWKTGRPPPDDRALAVAAVQLATYRLAAAELLARPPALVRAAFVHVAAGVTIAPADLLDAEGLALFIQRALSAEPPPGALEQEPPPDIGRRADAPGAPSGPFRPSATDVGRAAGQAAADMAPSVL